MLSKRRSPAPPRPDLPDDRPRVPGPVYRDIRAATRPGEVEDVAAAVGVAGGAQVVGGEARATELLRWARSRAPRSGAVREGLGVALYLAGAFEEAAAELQAYRRLTGRADQNHLLADCARAARRWDKVTEYVDEMVAQGVDPARIAEARIVQAGALADRGEHERALAVLQQALDADDGVRPWHLRMFYAAGDIAEQHGDEEAARDWFAAAAALDEDFLDVRDRLAALED